MAFWPPGLSRTGTGGFLHTRIIASPGPLNSDSLGCEVLLILGSCPPSPWLVGLVMVSINHSQNVEQDPDSTGCEPDSESPLGAPGRGCTGGSLTWLPPTGPRLPGPRLELAAPQILLK